MLLLCIPWHFNSGQDKLHAMACTNANAGCRLVATNLPVMFLFFYSVSFRWMQYLLLCWLCDYSILPDLLPAAVACLYADSNIVCSTKYIYPYVILTSTSGTLNVPILYPTYYARDLFNLQAKKRIHFDFVKMILYCTVDCPVSGSIAVTDHHRHHNGASILIHKVDVVQV